MGRRARRGPDDTEDIDEAVDLPPVMDAGDLDDLDDPEFGDISWNVYRMRTTEDMAKAGSNAKLRVWLTKKLGPINLAEIQAEFGGGGFEFWGKRNGLLVKRERRDLEGDPIIRKVPLAAVNGNASSPAVKTDASSSTLSPDELVRRAVRRERRRAQAELERQQRAETERRLEQQIVELKQVVAQAVARPQVESKPERLKDLIEGIVMLKQLSPDTTAGMQPMELLQAARDWMNQGIVLGEKREPGTTEGGDGWNAERVTAIAQALASVLSRFTPPRPAYPPGQAPPPTATAGSPPKPTDSYAEVVQPQPSQPDSPTNRWKAALEMVSRNMVRARGPEDTAASLEDLLNEDELVNLRGQQIEGVWRPTSAEALAWVESQGLGKFPQLESTGGLVYMDSVLAELRKPDADGE